MKIFDVAIIGGGPAGMMAGIIVSKSKKLSILIEKNNFLGQKLLATGNGRCNITNRSLKITNYHGHKPSFVAPIFNQFNHRDTVKYFESINVSLKEEDQGRLFPKSDQAKTIVAALTAELVANNIKINLAHSVKKIERKTNWHITLDQGELIVSKKLILTTGGKAAFQFGSSGDGLFWAQKLGHTIEPIYAALVPIETLEDWPAKVQGIKIKSKVSAFYKNKLEAENWGDLLFTHYGLSGPAIMGISGQIAHRIKNINHPVKLVIDLLPSLTLAALEDRIGLLFETKGSKSILNNLHGLMPTNLISQALLQANINQDQKSAEISKRERTKISQSLKAFPATIKKLRPLKEAQVTRGGISLREVDDKTLESLIVRDLYFAGEILDIDGDSGGYNLQWAWSSGYVAGRQASIE